MRVLLCLTLVLAAAAGQEYVLEASVSDAGGRRLSSSGYACGLSAGQAVASSWLAGSGYRALLGFWNRVLPVSGVTGPGPSSRVDERAWLGPCSPNPVRQRGVVCYGLPRPADVRLEVFDHAGRSVGTLVDARQGPGSYRVVWDIRRVQQSELPNGVYFLRLVGAGSRAVRKAVVAR